MAKRNKDLDPVCCPNGCDPRFIVYLHWEEDAEQRVQEEYKEFENDQVTSTWMLGLRCSDCAVRFAAKNVKPETKKALDESIRNGIAEMSELAAQLYREKGEEK